MKKILIGLLLILMCFVLVYLLVQGQKSKDIQKNPIVDEQKEIKKDSESTSFSLTNPVSPTLGVIEAKEIFLEVSQPINNITVKTSSVIVKGKTVANADVFINEKELRSDKVGNFSTSITLDEGDNIITIVVNDENGKVAEKDIAITYNSGTAYQ